MAEPEWAMVNYPPYCDYQDPVLLPPGPEHGGKSTKSLDDVDPAKLLANLPEAGHPA